MHLSTHAAAALRARILIGLLGYGVGFSLASVTPLASIGVYALMPLLYLVPSRIDRQVDVDNPPTTRGA